MAFKMIQHYRRGARGQAAFTLLEGIIAIGIISTGLIVGLALAYSNLVAAHANDNRILAAHLAREGLEAVHNVRDSNWLRRDANIDKDAAPDVQFYAWDDFVVLSGAPGDQSEQYFDVFMNQLPGTPAYILQPADKLDGVFALEVCIVNAKANNLAATPCRIQKLGNQYLQSASVISGANFVNFYRRIEMQSICWNGSSETLEEADANGLLNCSSGSKIGVLAISKVMWEEGQKLRDLQVKERLYDWR